MRVSDDIVQKGWSSLTLKIDGLSQLLDFLIVELTELTKVAKQDGLRVITTDQFSLVLSLHGAILDAVLQVHRSDTNVQLLDRKLLLLYDEFLQPHLCHQTLLFVPEICHDIFFSLLSLGFLVASSSCRISSRADLSHATHGHVVEIMVVGPLFMPCCALRDEIIEYLLLGAD